MTIVSVVATKIFRVTDMQYFHIITFIAFLSAHTIQVATLNEYYEQ